jgi:enolase
MPDTTIVKTLGRRVWDSRGRATVEAEIHLACGARGRAIAPAGASRGSREAVDLRDLDALGVKAAVANVNGAIAGALRGLDATRQEDIDARLIGLDDTPNKARLGANATVAASLAALHAAARSQDMPLFLYLAQGQPISLPLPEIQIFGGGAHAGRRIDIQDLMVMPLAARNFDEALEMTARVYHAAGEIMRGAGKLRGVADEGGWWPEFASNEEAIETLMRAIERAGFVPGDEVAISLDIAASEFGAGGRYRLGLEGRSLDSDGMCELILGWLERYAIISVEDPLAEDDRTGMMRFTAAAGGKVQIIGDDYLTTSAARVRTAIADQACNAVLLKPNQCGTVTETRAALDAAKAAGWGCIVSARSGETEDVSIVHLATGWNAGQLKVGSFARGERMAKWNEGLRIEEMLGVDARFAGRNALPIMR